MRAYRTYQVDAFTREKLLGNPAGVITNAEGLSETEMQMIAREMNNSETAFIFSPSNPAHDVWVRFFTPTNEVPICGHATIAAHYVRALEKHLGNVRVLQKTGAGILPVDVIREGDDYQIVMTQGKVTFGDTLSEAACAELQKALGIGKDDLRPDCPVQIVSTGHSKVMVGIRDRALLDRLHPDMDALIRISRNIQCNGYYVFTLHPDQPDAVHGRMFAPAIGITEDPVTGNANGPLGAYLAKLGLLPVVDGKLSFTAVQGEAIHRKGTMDVHVKVENSEPVEVQIVGNATIAFATTLLLDER
ncbi:MAG: PhzF family isomerase [Eubacteriales bacterium]|nr:PhzF family isomerase [Eubacteriales bacterium]